MSKSRGEQNEPWPPVLRRAAGWWLGLSAFFVAATIAWAVLRRPLGLPRGGWFRFVPLALSLSPILVLVLFYLFRLRGIHRALIESEGRLCTHCAYDLSKLPEAGTCPECGKAWNFERDKKLWESVGARYGETQNPPASPTTDDRP